MGASAGQVNLVTDETQSLEALDLRVKDVMTPSPLSLDANAKIDEAARGMERCDCGCCLVESKGKVVGIVTERDIVRRVAAKGSPLKATKVRAIMSSPIVVVNPETTVEEALKTMANSKIKRLAVVDEKGLVGIVSITDIAKALAKKSGQANLLIDAITRQSRAPEGIYL
jgi:CBS domain-containing protein